MALFYFDTCMCLHVLNFICHYFFSGALTQEALKGTRPRKFAFIAHFRIASSRTTPPHHQSDSRFSPVSRLSHLSHRAQNNASVAGGDDFNAGGGGAVALFPTTTATATVPSRPRRLARQARDDAFPYDLRKNGHVTAMILPKGFCFCFSSSIFVFPAICLTTTTARRTS